MTVIGKTIASEVGQIEIEPLTNLVIGAGIEVHKSLGPGFLETIYERATLIQLSHRGILAQQQLEVEIEHRSNLVGKHRLDLLVDRQLVVELKAVKAIEDIHIITVRSYLRATGCLAGLILNFGEPTLGIMRVYPKDNVASR